MTEARWGILEAPSDRRPMARQEILARMGVNRMPGYPFTHLVAGGLIERLARATYVITADGVLAKQVDERGGGVQGRSHNHNSATMGERYPSCTPRNSHHKASMLLTVTA